MLRHLHLWPHAFAANVDVRLLVVVGGATFPVFAMDSMIQSMAQLFPLRHYYMIYQMCIFNGYPLSYAWFDFLFLIIFAFLPMFSIKNIKKAMLVYVYIP